MSFILSVSYSLCKQQTTCRKHIIKNNGTECVFSLLFSFRRLNIVCFKMLTQWKEPFTFRQNVSKHILPSNIHTHKKRDAQAVVALSPHYVSTLDKSN